MGRTKLSEEEKFIKNSQLKEVYDRAKKIDRDIWPTLQGIREHYEEYANHCAAIAQQTLLEILGKDGINGIHSARFRVKDLDSLLIKVVKKKAYLSEEIQDDYEIEKYRELNADNYYKIITDIIGIRILIRYREQWEHVHKWIWNKYYKGDEKYLKDFVRDYNSNGGKSFIAEKPKVYYRNQKDLAFYEQMGKDIFEFRESDEGYNSIHYLVNIDGKYVEIQVRTILDEAWSECTHDIVYKCTSPAKKEELEYLSQCLAQQTIAAETITNLMYEKVNKNGRIYKRTPKVTSGSPPPEKKIKSRIEDRMKLLESQKGREFNGDIDTLI